MAIPQYEVEFTRDGTLYDATQATRVLDDLAQYTDLLVVSHGWNNDMAEARALYATLLDNVDKVMGLGLLPSIGGRRFASMNVFWPSKKFADEELIPGGGAASATVENDAALVRILERLRVDRKRLGDAEAADDLRKAIVDSAIALVPKLENDAEARKDFVFHLRSLLSPTDAHREDGSQEFFERPPEELFKGLSGAVTAPAGKSAGGSVAFARAGGAAGLGDLVKGMKGAARRIANFVTYYEMKHRAGVVGRVGVAPLLLRIRDRSPGIRLHLVGHSFGGRLVTAAAHALPANTPLVSVSLLQAAFSHNGLSTDYDKKGGKGAFHEVLSDKRVPGPIVITHTKNDLAVGVAYPLASRLALDAAAALGDANDPYGGMGRNGAQHVDVVDKNAGQLLAVGGKYPFQPGKVYNLRADDFIKDHGDVAGPQVAYAILNAAGAS